MKKSSFYTKPLILILLVSLSYYVFVWTFLSLATFGQSEGGYSPLSLTPIFSQERFPLLLLWAPIYFLILRQAYNSFTNKSFFSFLKRAYPLAAWHENEPVYGIRMAALVGMGWVFLAWLQGTVQFALGAFSGFWMVSVLGLFLWVITDELCFRGVIPILLESNSRWSRIVISTLFFTLSRAILFPISIPGLVGIFILGFTLGFLVDRWQSLWGATIFHGTILFLWGWVFGLPIGGEPLHSLLTTSDVSLFWGGWYGPLASPICWILLAFLPLILEFQRLSSRSPILWITNLLGGKSAQKL